MTKSSSRILKFLSTPSGWRATSGTSCVPGKINISIHALRVEGDRAAPKAAWRRFQPFLSTPSGWRATICGLTPMSTTRRFLSTPSGWRATKAVREQLRHRGISIHALRVEGDHARASCTFRAYHFYPRPPGGGRPSKGYHNSPLSVFLSTPSGWRATLCHRWALCARKFLSTPSGWRATAKTDKVFVCFCAKGRRIYLFKTRKEKICR